MNLNNIIDSELELRIENFLAKQYSLLGDECSNTSMIFLEKRHEKVYNYKLKPENNKKLRIYYEVRKPNEKNKKSPIKKIIIWPKGAASDDDISNATNISFYKGRIRIRPDNSLGNFMQYRPCIIMEEGKIIIGYDNFEKKDVIKKYKIKKFSVKKLEELITNHGIPAYPNPPSRLPRVEQVLNRRTIMYQGINGWKKFLKNMKSLDKKDDKKKDEKEKIIICKDCGTEHKKEEELRYCPQCGHDL